MSILKSQMKNSDCGDRLRSRTGMLRASASLLHAVWLQGVTTRRRDALNSRFCIELAGAAADRGTPRETVASSRSGNGKSRPSEIQNNARRTFGAAARCW